MPRVFLSLLCIIFLFAGCSAQSTTTHPFVQKIEQMTLEGDAGLAQAFSEIHKAPESLNEVIISWLRSKNQTLSAPFSIELGKRIFSTDKNEGLKWYILGRIRATYDAERCTDKTSTQAISILVMEYKDLPLYGKEHPGDFLNAWDAALKWEKVHKYSASPMWICSHGIQAFSQPKEKLVFPDSEWDKLYDKTIVNSENYLSKHRQNGSLK